MPAKEKFENGDFYARREIITHLGLNLILKDKKVTIEVKEPIEVIRKVSKDVNRIAKRFEPLKKSINKDKFNNFLNTNTIWGRIQNHS